MNSKKYLMGIDVGGSHVTAAMIDAETFEMLPGSEARRHIDSCGEVDAVLSAFVEAIRASAGEQWDNVEGIGVAFPAPFDYPNGICLITPEQNKFTNFYGVNVKQELATRLSFAKPIKFLNDAAAFAIGEYFAGGAKGSARSLVITLGTGFGASFLAEGRPVVTGGLVPEGGELWDQPFKGGIADDNFSTRGIVKAWKAASGEDASGVKEIAQAALKGDARGIAMFNAFGEELAAFLAPWLTKFGVDRFVIGGNIARDWDLFVPAFEAALPAHGAGGVTVRPSHLGENAQIVGAALSLALV
ncbi:MAG: ROK family protein [Kiritimatiellaeota bacterium]|nr:ROK family protein [Kiritimatiellota bacterium]